MPSESVSSFLDQARAGRVIPADELDDLFRQPDVPQADLAAVCEALLSRGVLTPFQADAVRAGKFDDLTFAGYPVVANLGPCPGGTAYRVLHPSLRTPLVLRRLRTDWLAPADNVVAFITRAQTACPLVHANLAHLLDAGVARDEPFVTMDPCEGADLQSLVTDIGPMPTSLVVAYATQLAEALHAAHKRGVTHGEVRPGWVFVHPLTAMNKTKADGTPRVRPAADATVKLSELGLIPRRPPLAEWDASPDVRPYLAPERLHVAEPTPAGDVYSLGATVYFLMTGQHPTLNAAPLNVVRTDAPTTLVDIVHAMLSADPAARPSAKMVASRLAEPDDVPLAVAAEPVEDVPLVAEPAAWVATPVDEASATNAPAFTPHEYDEPQGWVPPPDDPKEEAERKAARATKKPDDSAANKWMWIGVGAGLQVIAILGWIYYMSTASGCSSSDPPAKKSTIKQKK